MAAYWCFGHERSNVPYISGGLPLLGHIRILKNSTEAFRLAHAQYGDIFRFRLLGRDYYVLNDKLLFEGFKRHKELSFHQALPRMILTRAFFVVHKDNDPFHATVLRNMQPKHLERNIGHVQHMLETELDKILQRSGAGHLLDWARILPLWMMERWVRAFTHWPNHHRALRRLMVPEIERRVRLYDHQTKHVPADKPDDVLQWLIDYEPRDDPDWMFKCAMRLVGLFFAHINMAPVFFLLTLADLTGRPDLRERLRNEQRRVVGAHGATITPTALEDMTLLDACFLESTRIHAAPITLQRLVTQDTVFSDGSVVPRGSIVYMSSVSINCSAKLHGEDWREYRPERHLEPGKQRKAIAIQHEVLMFGSGRHACPGRFLAVSEMKRLACLVLRGYDFTTASGQPYQFKPLFFEPLTHWVDVGLVLCVVLLTAWIYCAFFRDLSNVPYISGGVPILGDVQVLQNSVDVFYDAHAKHGDIFRFRLYGRDYYVLNEKLLFEGFKKNKELSFPRALPRMSLTKAFFGLDEESDRFHVDMLRTVLPKQLGAVMERIQRVLEDKFHETLGASETHTIEEPYKWCLYIVSSGISQFLVGPELGSSPELFRTFVSLPIGANALFDWARVLPLWVMNLWVNMLTSWPTYRETVRRLVVPEIQRRVKLEQMPQEAAAAGAVEKPNDVLQWLLDIGPRDDPNWMTKCTQRLLGLSFASMHTTTHFFHLMMTDLASRPDIRAALRDEQRRVVASHGAIMIPAALDAMTLLDACFLETARVHSHPTFTQRLAVQDAVFSNGARVPKGSTVYMSPLTINFSASLHGNDWRDYRPQRHLEQKKHRKSTAIQHQVLVFGSGRHACPGRFLAVSEIKRLACLLVRSYDFTTLSGKPFQSKAMFFGSQVVDQPIVFTRLSPKERIG
ncbi:hypothetical protein H4R34_002747 [Dimargaris verticillata]|uniref:Cytochrome P450 n=1 Tax=Dimargaris verticillata TaxID=2761393 RepID=A0A9W8B8W0_9FUNG|nr:hypothetical protein H4R34_002747 [Dimargaris verticillata]